MNPYHVVSIPGALGIDLLRILYAFMSWSHAQTSCMWTMAW